MSSLERTGRCVARMRRRNKKSTRHHSHMAVSTHATAVSRGRMLPPLIPTRVPWRQPSMAYVECLETGSRFPQPTAGTFALGCRLRSPARGENNLEAQIILSGF